MSDLKQPDPNVEVPSVASDKETILKLADHLERNDVLRLTAAEIYELRRIAATNADLIAQLRQSQLKLDQVTHKLNQYRSGDMLSESAIAQLKQYEQQVKELQISLNERDKWIYELRDELENLKEEGLREQLKQKDERIAFYEAVLKEFATITFLASDIGGSTSRKLGEVYRKVDALKVGSPDMPGE